MEDFQETIAERSDTLHDDVHAHQCGSKLLQINQHYQPLLSSELLSSHRLQIGLSRCGTSKYSTIQRFVLKKIKKMYSKESMTNIVHIYRFWFSTSILQKCSKMKIYVKQLTVRIFLVVLPTVLPEGRKNHNTHILSLRRSQFLAYQVQQSLQISLFVRDKIVKDVVLSQSGIFMNVCCQIIEKLTVDAALQSKSKLMVWLTDLWYAIASKASSFHLRMHRSLMSHMVSSFRNSLNVLHLLVRPNTSFEIVVSATILSTWSNFSLYCCCYFRFIVQIFQRGVCSSGPNFILLTLTELLFSVWQRFLSLSLHCKIYLTMADAPASWALRVFNFILVICIFAIDQNNTKAMMSDVAEHLLRGVEKAIMNQKT